MLPVTPFGSDPVNALPLADLRRVVLALVAQLTKLQASVDRLGNENAALKAENISLKDEIARLKGLPSRPKVVSRVVV
jgi:cell division protein FtsB